MVNQTAYNITSIQLPFIVVVCSWLTVAVEAEVVSVLSEKYGQ